MSCLRSLLSLLLILAGLALFIVCFFAVMNGSAGLGTLGAAVLGVILVVLATVNSAHIVKAQEERKINKLIDRRLQQRR